MKNEAIVQPKLLSKISLLFESISKDPFTGIGKPEPLKYDFKGYWSRRINSEHRLIYKIENELVIIAKCRFHYQD
ncbi:MAG: Txe/YoeB family addiction module toxin [bacterium]